MANLRLMTQFLSIFDTRQLNDLYDILADNFYFKSPNVEISGKNEYIQYVKNNDRIFSTETEKLYAKEDDLYIHEYILTIYDSAKKYSDQIEVIEEVQILNGLIASSIVDYKPEDFSNKAKDLLDIVVEKHRKTAINS